MLQKGTALADRIKLAANNHEDGIYIVPHVEGLETGSSGAASIDIRLGRWFRAFRASRASCLDIREENSLEGDESRVTREYFVRFGDCFILHPSKFVLGITLEWLRLPKDVAAYVTGKSSWGRRGLIIETAAGVHPGYSGCLTLEMTNLGEVPIALIPGMKVCQIFLHSTEGDGELGKSQFSGMRKPALGQIRVDEVVRALQLRM